MGTSGAPLGSACRIYGSHPFGWETHTLTAQAAHRGQWGEFAWYTTNGWDYAKFYRTNNGDLRNVDGVKTQLIKGEQLSGYGRGTAPPGGPGGWTGELKYLSRSDGAGTERLACWAWDPAGGGDSGGPIFDNTLATGFIVGALPIDGKDRLCFSQARYIDDALGINIKQ